MAGQLDDLSVQFGQMRQSIHDLRNDVLGLTLSIKEHTQQTQALAGTVKQQGDDIAEMKPEVESYRDTKNQIKGMAYLGGGGGLAGAYAVAKAWFGL